MEPSFFRNYKKVSHDFRFCLQAKRFLNICFCIAQSVFNQQKDRAHYNYVQIMQESDSIFILRFDWAKKRVCLHILFMFCFQARSTGSPLSQFLYGPAADPLSSPPPAHMGKQFYLQDLSKDLLILCAWCFIKVLFIFQASDLLCTLCLTRNIPIPCLELINWLLGKKKNLSTFSPKVCLHFIHPTH